MNNIRLAAIYSVLALPQIPTYLMLDNSHEKLDDKLLHLCFRDKLRHRGVEHLAQGSSVYELRFELSSSEFQIPYAFY